LHPGWRPYLELKGAKPFRRSYYQPRFCRGGADARAGGENKDGAGFGRAASRNAHRCGFRPPEDRRCVRVNLQICAVLPGARTTLGARLHLLTGIGSYLTAPLWLRCFWCSPGILFSVAGSIVRPNISKGSFPCFPVARAGSILATWVFVGHDGLLIVQAARLDLLVNAPPTTVAIRRRLGVFVGNS